MRTIERSTAFKRDYKREARGQHRATLDSGLVPVLEALAEDTAMEVRHRDHELSGDWSGYRELCRKNATTSAALLSGGKTG